MSNFFHLAISELYTELRFLRKLPTFPNRARLASDLLLSQAKIKKLYPKIYPFYPSELPKPINNIKSYKPTTCSIVFNSADLLNKKLGNNIDDSDIVIRINFSPTVGFNQDLGTKTSFRILGKDWIFFENTSEYLIHSYNSISYYHNDALNLSSSKRYQELNLLVFDPYLATECPHDLIGSGVTNGFRAVLLGLALCDKVVIYGANLKTLFLLKQRSVSHFPDHSFYETVRNKLAPLSLTVDNSLDYFSNIKSNKDRAPHKSLHREYLFYLLHSRVSFARTNNN